jgi:probable HAF family extracellular repeat protein
MQDLGTLPGGRDSSGLANNDKGQVVGYSETGSGSQSLPPGLPVVTPFGGPIFPSPMIAHAVVFNYGKVQDLGTLGGTNSVALGINSAGNVVGAAETASGLVHAFVYKGGSLVDIGTLSNPPGPAYNNVPYSEANAINNAGQIVGSSNGHAFLFDQGRMFDLNSLMPIPNVTLVNAISINNLGQIMVWGEDPYIQNSNMQEYLLTPTSLGQAEFRVPEPSTFALFGLVASILIVRHRGAALRQYS